MKSADWKYQSSVCSAWSMITCCLNVDILLPLSGSRVGIENMDPCLKVVTPTLACKNHFVKNVIESVHRKMCFCVFVLFIQEGLKVWAHQIQEGLCLFDCKRIPEDMELTSGQVVLICTTQKNWFALLTARAAWWVFWMFIESFLPFAYTEKVKINHSHSNSYGD